MVPGFHFRLPIHGELDEEFLALLHGNAFKFQLENLLYSLCVVQEPILHGGISARSIVLTASVALLSHFCLTLNTLSSSTDENLFW